MSEARNYLIVPRDGAPFITFTIPPSPLPEWVELAVDLSSLVRTANIFSSKWRLTWPLFTMASKNLTIDLERLEYSDPGPGVYSLGNGKSVTYIPLDQWKPLEVR